MRTGLQGFSYKEKSLAISLVAVAMVYCGYFLGVWRGSGASTLADTLGAMIGTVVALIAVHVIYHIVIALDDEPEAEDERDLALRRRAAVLGYDVLSVAVLATLGRILIVGGLRTPGQGPALTEVANLLLAGLVLSELVYYTAQLYLYRRGVHG